MSETEAPITITLKAGTGYDAPWLVIRGFDPDDVTAKLNSLDPVIEATLTAAGKFAAGSALGATTVSQEAPQRPPSEAPAQRQQGWGQTPAAQQQGAAAAQQGGRSKFGGQLHPEGKTCEACPNVLEKKQTSSGKNVWRCSDWRWANGNPNGHTSIFID